jgi:hypothetical protein
MMRRMGAGCSLMSVGVAKILSASAIWGCSNTSMIWTSQRFCSAVSQIRLKFRIADRDRADWPAMYSLSL